MQEIHRTPPLPLDQQPMQEWRTTQDSPQQTGLLPTLITIVQQMPVEMNLSELGMKQSG